VQLDEALSPQAAAVATHHAVVVAAVLALAAFIFLVALFIAAALSLAPLCAYFFLAHTPAASHRPAAGSSRRDPDSSLGRAESPPDGGLPLHDGRRHLAGAHLRHRRSPLASPLAQLLLLLPACAHNPTACLCALAFCWQLQELQGRLKKAILEYVVLAGSSLSP